MVWSRNWQDMLKISLSFFISKKTWWNTDIYINFHKDIFNFGLFFTEIGYFELSHDYDVTLEMLVLILVCIERGDPQGIKLWDQFVISGGFICKFTGAVTIPLW